MTEAQERRRAIRQVLLASLWLTLLVFAVKIWIGWATRSLSLIAESLHTLIQSFSTLLSVIAMSSSHTANREVWGHSKLESTSAFLLTAVLGFACFTLFAVSIQQLEALAQGVSSTVLQAAATFPPVQINLPLLQLLGVVITTNFCLACFGRYEAKVLESIAIRGNTNYLFRDTCLMTVVLVGLIGTGRGFTWLDPIIAIVMAFLAIGSCWQIFNWQLPSLIRQIAIAPEALAQTIHQVEGITHCYGIQSRGVVGRQIFVEMRLILHPECMSIARSIAERVERAIRERYGPARVVIYIDSDQLKPKHARTR